jgi:hypothetical protein
MSVDADLFAAVQAYAPLTALIGAGTNCRFYPDQAPQDAPYPFIVPMRLAGIPEVHLEGLTDLWNGRYQFSIWGDDFDVVCDVADKLVKAVMAATAFQKIPLNVYAGPVEPELKAFHRIAEFSIWYET